MPTAKHFGILDREAIFRDFSPGIYHATLGTARDGGSILSISADDDVALGD